MSQIPHKCTGLPEHARAYVVPEPKAAAVVTYVDVETGGGWHTAEIRTPNCAGCGAHASSLLASSPIAVVR